MNTATVARSFALVGVGLAIGFALAAARPSGSAVTAQQRALPERALASKPGEPLTQEQQVRSAYLTALSQAAAARTPDAEHVPSDDPQVNDPTPEDYVRQARAEPLDATWAPEQTAKLESELSLASEHLDFRYSNLSCRTKQCSVDLEWRTAKAARTAFKTGFANEFKQTRCMQRLLLPDGAPDDQPTRSAFILTCARPDAAALAAQ
jgi:hypothetical protein